MSKMFVTLLISFLLVNRINCAFIRTWDEKNAVDDVFTNGSIIDNNVVSENTVGLYVDKYSYDDTQVNEIKNLPNLKNIWMYTIGQEEIVKLENLPNLLEIDLSKNELVYVSRSMFKDTPVKSVWLYNNKISAIEKRSFRSSVTLVSLYCNLLTTIKTEWFEDPSKITWLEFHGNKITHIKENTFKPFVNLKGINLVFNEIQTIGDGAFAATNIYDEIYLAYNKLKSLSPKIFPSGRVKIDNFDIRYNELTYLPIEFLNKTTIGSIHLIDGNPWSCACYLKHITKWINWESYGTGDYHPKDREGEPRCVSGKGTEKNTCIEKVDEEIISVYKENSSPVPNTRENYCPCRFNGKSWKECYHI